MKNKLIAKLVGELIASDDTDKIERALLGERVHPCVAREWAGEPRRRDALTSQWARARARREALQFGKQPNSSFRRIISSFVFPTPKSALAKEFERLGLSAREYQFHATKGRRNYRVVK